MAGKRGVSSGPGPGWFGLESETRDSLRPKLKCEALNFIPLRPVPREPAEKSPWKLSHVYFGAHWIAQHLAPCLALTSSAGEERHCPISIHSSLLHWTCVECLLCAGLWWFQNESVHTTPRPHGGPSRVEEKQDMEEANLNYAGWQGEQGRTLKANLGETEFEEGSVYLAKGPC